MDLSTDENTKKISREWIFKHTTVSPRHSQANGLVEKSVEIVNRILERADMEGSDPYIGFLEYRNTPIGNCGSPAQMLMSRRLKALIPCTDKQLLPMIHKTTQDIQETIRAQKQKQKAHYDKTATDLPPLHRGDSVRIQEYDTGRWRPAVVKEVAETPRSYIVETAQGRQLRRNRKHLLKTGDTEEKTVESSSDEDKDTASQVTRQVTYANQDVANKPTKSNRSGRIIKTPARYED